jgi:hypothetical protein
VLYRFSENKVFETYNDWVAEHMNMNRKIWSVKNGEEILTVGDWIRNIMDINWWQITNIFIQDNAFRCDVKRPDVYSSIIILNKEIVRREN